MKVVLRILGLSIIVILLFFGYRKANNATKTKVSQVYGITKNTLNNMTFKKTRGITPPMAGNSYSVQALYTIIQANSRSADFIVTDAGGTRSFGGANNVLGANWQSKMLNANSVTLKQGSFINPNSIPSRNTLNRLGNPSLSGKVKGFINWFIAKHRKAILYFNYPSDASPTHRLYLVDPDPGSIKIIANQILIPAYTNVLSKWNID